MTASQLAVELEVSLRTVLRDIDALGSAGIPIYGVRGKLGGFELVEGYTSDLPSARMHHRSPVPAERATRARLWLSPRGRRLAVLVGRPPGLRIRKSPAAEPGREGWVQAWIPVEDADATVIDLLALGAEAEVIAPPDLRRRVRETALLIAGLHGEPLEGAS